MFLSRLSWPVAALAVVAIISLTDAQDSGQLKKPAVGQSSPTSSSPQSPAPVTNRQLPAANTTNRQPRQTTPPNSQPEVRDASSQQRAVSTAAAKGNEGKTGDAVLEAQTARTPAQKRPEQQLSDHDRSKRFAAPNAVPASAHFAEQPKQGKILGFDFFRDGLNSEKPLQMADEVIAKETENKPKVMQAQRDYLERRFDLKPRHETNLTMTRGKPICVGPTARLARGVTWDDLSKLSAKEIRERDLFPYAALPHPLQVNGGQVFPKMQIEMFPRLQRFDVDFDLPEEFLPEFPPAIFLQNRPELGDVSRGEIVSINNFRRLFKDLLTPVQLDGLRLLLTPLPQEEFNATDDRKTLEPSLGVACFDCHVNGHTTGQFHLSPDIRPQERRFRLDTVSLRGVFNQQIHGSKRSLRSVEDFTEFEQRTAYFNGDPIHAMKKGFVELPRQAIPHMAQMQNMFDFPPAPKLNVVGRLDSRKANESELRGEKLFFGKAQCSVCHPAPFYLDHQMHDLRVERFLKEEPGDGPIKTFTLRGIKESPPFLHDGRCLTLEDTVEFFNLVLELQLDAEERKDLVAFMRCL